MQHAIKKLLEKRNTHSFSLFLLHFFFFFLKPVQFNPNGGDSITPLKLLCVDDQCLP